MKTDDLLLVVIVVVFGFFPPILVLREYLRLRPYRRDDSLFSLVHDSFFWWRMLRPDLYTDEGLYHLRRLYIAFGIELAGLLILFVLLFSLF